MPAGANVEPPADRRPCPSRCSRCDGPIREAPVTLVYTIDRSPKIVHAVTAGVCQSCGERHLRSEVASRIEDPVVGDLTFVDAGGRILRRVGFCGEVRDVPIPSAAAAVDVYLSPTAALLYDCGKRIRPAIVGNFTAAFN